MKAAKLFLPIFLIGLYSCGGSETAKDVVENTTSKEISTESEMDEAETSTPLYSEYPAAVGECPEKSLFNFLQFGGGSLSRFAEHNILGRADFSKILIEESQVTPGNYKIFVFYSNKDMSIEEMHNGPKGELEEENDFILKVFAESKGLPGTGTYSADESSDLMFNGISVYGKGKGDDKFMNNVVKPDKGAEFMINSISETEICGSFKFIGLDPSNKLDGQFNTSWSANN